MPLAQDIETALRTAFAPADVVVTNDSHRHAGHAGDDGSGESHWSVRITAAAFAGQSRIDRHRAVHQALGPAIMGRIHALALDLRTPD